MKAVQLIRILQTMTAQAGKDLEVQIQTADRSFAIGSVEKGTLQEPTEPMTRGTAEAIVLRVQ